MYYLLAQDCSKAFYLIDNEEYILGRKACDIIIQNDTSISRKHAKISIKQAKIEITDLGARYNTFINNKKIQPNENIGLNVGDEIKFGILNSIYIFKEENLSTASSGLNSQEKNVLTKIVKELNGTVESGWSKKCSYLTVNEIMLTLKTLCALIEDQPIVTIDFWVNFAKSVKGNLPPPDHNNYKAHHSESVINKSIFSVNPQSRRSLFHNKVFIFKTKLSIGRIQAAVELAGGTCIHFNENKITNETISSCNPEYILIQDENNSNQNDSFTKIVKYLQSIGKRSIPFQEIAMAIVTGSCEKNCNPSFDRTGILIKNEEMVFTSEILATNTETQNESFEEKPTIIVPETELNVRSFESMDRLVSNTNANSFMQDNQGDRKTSTVIPITVDSTITKDTSCTTVKREGCEMHNNNNKRVRLENSEVGGYSSVFGSNPLNFNAKEGKIITSTQNSCKDEDMDIKPLESIDGILNETDELEQYKATIDNSNKHKRIGEDMHKDSKRIRVETSNKNGKSSGTLLQQSTPVKPSTVIDLTHDESKIITSTQITKTNMQRSFEPNTKKSKAENPFSFTRCESKSKSRNNPKISDFLKPLPKPTGCEEDVINIVDEDSTLARGKTRSPEKSSLKQNPFALNKQKGTTSNKSFTEKPTTSSFKKNDMNKVNPFGDLRKTVEKNTKRNTNENRQREEYVPYTYDIPVIDLETEKSYSWLSKDISITDETDHSLKKNTAPIDEDMKKFLESFRDCVVVERIPEPAPRISQNRSREESFGGKENFKKFKKVQPLHVQTTIMPRSVYSTC